MGKTSSSGSASTSSMAATPITTKIGNSTFTFLSRGAAAYIQPSIGLGNPWEKADSKPQPYELAGPKRNPYTDRKGFLEVEYDKKPGVDAYRLARFEMNRPQTAASYGGIGMSRGGEYNLQDVSYISGVSRIKYDQAKKCGCN